MSKTNQSLDPSPVKPTLYALTPREQEIVCLLAQGLTNRAIASQLHIAEGTVKKLVYNCYRKLEIASRVELITLLMK